ncbi:hypothetical protein [Tahibacter aquaticus]|nr:hypothetical protein [Tahibacter aquaticus]
MQERHGNAKLEHDYLPGRKDASAMTDFCCDGMKHQAERWGQAGFSVEVTQSEQMLRQYSINFRSYAQADDKIFQRYFAEHPTLPAFKIGAWLPLHYCPWCGAVLDTVVGKSPGESWSRLWQRWTTKPARAVFPAAQLAVNARSANRLGEAASEFPRNWIADPRLASLRLPDALLAMIHEGRWARWHDDGHFEPASLPIETPRLQAMVPDEDGLDLLAPPFRSALQEIEVRHAGWLQRWSRVELINPARTVIVADFPLGSDSLLALDYRDSDAEPRVIRLQWVLPQPERNNRWVVVSPTFAQFAQALGWN